jgi:hypothetical protein
MVKLDGTVLLKVRMLDRIVDHVGNLAQTSPIRPELINITASLESLASITAIASVWNVCTETIRRARKLTATPNLCRSIHQT